MQDALARYAGTFHATADGSHHVASPLGAWLLLALCAPASSGADRAELEEVLGVDADRASSAAAALLAVPHPLVAAAAAVWHRLADDAPWLASLPPAVTRGRLAGQEQLDAWARERTFGLIERFPLTLTPDVILVLATALATRVSWDKPFDVVPAASLGAASAWATRLETVLRTPNKSGHDQYIADTARAGDVAVHTARARGGLLVTSVVAAPEVPPADVLAAAYDLAGGHARRRSLFELPLGESPLWTIAEEAAEVLAPDGREERCMAVLPAWVAESEHKLERADLGFPAAARAVGTAMGIGGDAYQAMQSAVARYSRVGFEAAAVTGMMRLLSAPIPHDGIRREAELRFGHPYAVVAVAEQHGGPWHGLPVFSAWVAEPSASA
jgi:hypothetical protein